VMFGAVIVVLTVDLAREMFNGPTGSRSLKTEETDSAGSGQNTPALLQCTYAPECVEGAFSEVGKHP
jgi:hypothetical protein